MQYFYVLIYKVIVILTDKLALGKTAIDSSLMCVSAYYEEVVTYEHIP